MAGTCGTYGGKRCSRKGLIGESEGPRRRWEDNIKMDPKKWVGRAWTRLIWLRVWTSVRVL